jgi:hypothetical protein
MVTEDCDDRRTDPGERAAARPYLIEDRIAPSDAIVPRTSDVPVFAKRLDRLQDGENRRHGLAVGEMLADSRQDSHFEPNTPGRNCQGDPTLTFSRQSGHRRPGCCHGDQK